MSNPLRGMLLAGLLLLCACKPAGQTVPLAASADAQPSSAKMSPPSAAQADAVKTEFPTLVVDTFDGKKFNLAEQRSKWVVVNFWATWCNPCLKEIHCKSFQAARGAT